MIFIFIDLRSEVVWKSKSSGSDRLSSHQTAREWRILYRQGVCLQWQRCRWTI